MSVKIKKTNEANAILTDFLKETNLKLAIETKDMSKKFCPVRTGALQDSITIKDDQTGISVGSNLPYAAAVEFGTRYQSPQPFMQQGLEQAIQNMS
jgi:HK97 gp10 family phage protein